PYRAASPTPSGSVSVEGSNGRGHARRSALFEAEGWKLTCQRPPSGSDFDRHASTALVRSCISAPVAPGLGVEPRRTPGTPTGCSPKVFGRRLCFRGKSLFKLQAASPPSTRAAVRKAARSSDPDRRRDRLHGGAGSGTHRSRNDRPDDST